MKRRLGVILLGRTAVAMAPGFVSASALKNLLTGIAGGREFIDDWWIVNVGDD